MAGKVRGMREAKANLNRIIQDIQGRKVVRAISANYRRFTGRAVYANRHFNAAKQPVSRHNRER